MSISYVTIASANYLAYAKVLAASLAQYAPDSRLTVLLVERASLQLRALVDEACLTVVFAEELALPDIDRLAYKYDILELNTALKPSFIKYMLAKGSERVVYVDPDIRFFSSPQVLDEALDEAAIVLTPHALAPVLDGQRPSDVDFLRSGAFNLGFVAVKRHAQSLAMLDWWEQRCLGLGFNDLSFGTFVDQKWMDLVPAYFESVKLLRHRGCNVAYWNLHERQFSGDTDEPRVGGDPLVFFHFSGVDHTRPELLSKHQTRHDVLPGGLLAGLIKDYCQALDKAGHARLQRIPYSYGQLDDGQVISPTMRRALCCEGMDEVNPFRSGSSFHAKLRASAISNSRKRSSMAKTVNTRNLQEQGAKLYLANLAVRLMARLLGPERALMLLRYAALLSRESHFASVLLKLPLLHQHRERR